MARRAYGALDPALPPGLPPALPPGLPPAHPPVKNAQLLKELQGMRFQIHADMQTVHEWGLATVLITSMACLLMLFILVGIAEESCMCRWPRWNRGARLRETEMARVGEQTI